MKKFASVLLILAMLVSVGAMAETQLTMSSGMIGDHILHKCSEKIISLIEERTNGEVTVKYYGGDTLGTTQERADMLMAGAVDIDMAALSVYDNYNPRQGIMSAFFMFENWDHYLKCTASDTYKDIIAGLEEATGITYLGEVYYAKRNFLSTKPIQSLADMKGLKFRVPNEAQPIAGITALGAAPTPMGGGEVYMALQNNTIQATENGADQIVNQAFYEVAPNMTFTAHQFQTMLYFMSGACKSKLTDEQYQIVVDAIKEACAEYNVLAQESEAKSETFLKENISCYEIDLTEFYQALENMYDEYDDIWGDGTWEAFKALA